MVWSDGVNDQNPFDVTPDDERRPAADAAQQDPFRRPVAPNGTESAAGSDELHASDDVDDLRDEPETPTTDARRRHRRIAALSIAAAVIFTAGAGGGAVASLDLARSTSSTSTDGGAGSSTQGGSGSQSGGGTQGGPGTQNGFGGGTQNGFGGQGGSGGFGSGSGSSGSGSTSTATAATADQIRGLVTVVTRLGYENGEAAGTGIILTSNGRILTNNHVIDGATSIKVTVESTGRSYTADVVGTNATKDIAVLQLANASGLTTADLAAKQAASGDTVTAVGNANGTGTLSAAKGTVSALDQTITTSSEGGTPGETLHGLIEVSADVVSGDSGGAVQNADGDVVGVTTAASSGSSDVTGYAIPISTATSIAKQIVDGEDTDEITLGLPAFLGVSLSADADAGSGAVVDTVLPGTAAAKTALAAGDTITAVDGTSIGAGSALSAAIAKHAPGDSVRISYTDAKGGSHTVTVTLTEGPAD
jgi:S1-C subfamily serine protease